MLEEHAVGGAVHRLEAKLLPLDVEQEHVLLVLGGVARRLPQLEVEDVWGDDLVVVALEVLGLDHVHQLVVDARAVRQEEARAGRDLVEEEELLRDVSWTCHGRVTHAAWAGANSRRAPAASRAGGGRASLPPPARAPQRLVSALEGWVGGVVRALLAWRGVGGCVRAREARLKSLPCPQLLLVWEGNAVHALQLVVARLAEPVGGRVFGQLEGLDAARAGEVRPLAEVDEGAAAVDGRRRAVRQLGRDEGLLEGVRLTSRACVSVWRT